ncbi:MAG TPA: NB-ARC domain-containing protein [Aggregatilineales bacterium]|nr:NB-ARC domain-containing protein [Aggregatilineales bacterium]
MASFSRVDNYEHDLQAILEDCLNNYESDIHLFQSPLATWEVVRCRLSNGALATPEQLALTVRGVLDDLIDGLHSSEMSDLNSPSMRRFIIADHLYRRGMKQTEICRSHLPLSKSQFYRERTETLTTLANCILQWEQQARESRKRKAIQRLSRLSPEGETHLIGVTPLLTQLTGALTSSAGPDLIVLSGQGGSGKTALARAAARYSLDSDRFTMVAVLMGQGRRFTGTSIQPTGAPVLSVDELLDQLIFQLRPGSVSDERLFDRVAAEAVNGQVTFDEVLEYLSRELDEQQPSRLTVLEKMPLVMDLLWSMRALIVVDGLEAAPDPRALMETLRQVALPTHTKVLITSRTRPDDVSTIRHFDVPGLAEEEAIHVLQSQAAERGIRAVADSPRDSLKQIVGAACGNPLVLRWIISQLTSLPAATVVADLCQTPDLSMDLYEYLYRNPWEALSEQARELLATLAQCPDPEVPWEALQACTGLKPAVLNARLKELVTSAFVRMSDTLEPTYQLTPLTRTFVLAGCLSD